MSQRLNPLVAAARVMCNRISLSPLQQKYGKAPMLPAGVLAAGTVLSQPLRPAMPDPNPHPLRFGYIFESRDLTEAEVASLRLHRTGQLVRSDG